MSRPHWPGDGSTTVEEASDRLVHRLIAEGHAETHRGDDVRMIAFGGKVGGRTPYLQIPLGHVARYLTGYVREHGALLRHVPSKGPALAFLVPAEKLRGSGSTA